MRTSCSPGWQVSRRAAIPGSAPRRRGALYRRARDRYTLGISPARAGSTAGVRRWCGRRQTDGISPARAGSTRSSPERSGSRWDQPRACGEHIIHMLSELAELGSPPRVRGAPGAAARCGAVDGINPARAGSTQPRPTPATPSRDQPRAGGEHVSEHPRARVPPGSIPRGRGARAGGEHTFAAVPWCQAQGSAPRERGARCEDRPPHLVDGISPARAGSTRTGRVAVAGAWDQPRASGEHHSDRRTDLFGSGSAPRERGAHRGDSVRAHDARISPARAGSTQRRQCPGARCTDQPRASGEHTSSPGTLHGGWAHLDQSPMRAEAAGCSPALAGVARPPQLSTRC
jgi:hypothetical protein